MGAFFLGLHPDNALADAAQADCAAASLGGDCVRQMSAGCTAVMARAGSDLTGPASDGDLLLLDGGLSAHCRNELQSALHLPETSDALLIQRAFAKWGAAAAVRLVGRFALVLVDRRRACVWLLRDPLGECSLYFAEQGGALSASTSASTLIAAARLPKRENPQAIAAFFALRAPRTGDSYWQGVHSVPAGECLCIGAKVTQRRSQAFACSEQPRRFDSDAQAVAAWRDVLRGACERAIAGARRPAVLLSGGVDSTALAALSAGLRPDLLAVSWCLPAFPKADETALVAATAGRLGIELRSTQAGADWPLARIAEWTVDPDAPLINPYRWLQDGVMQQAAEQGADVILSGNFGDHLYPDQARAASPWGHLRQRIRQQLDPHPRLLAWLRRVARRGAVTPDWLLPEWRRQLGELVWAGPAVLSPESIQEASLGRRFAAARGLDLRYVYRDPQVIRFMAALPEHWSQRGDSQKWITREMLRGAIPEPVRVRPKSGSLESYFRFGLYEREAHMVSDILRDRRARWPEYVHAPALFEALANPRSESDLLLVWLAISYELWWRAQAGLGPAVLASNPRLSA